MSEIESAVAPGPEPTDFTYHNPNLDPNLEPNLELYTKEETFFEPKTEEEPQYLQDLLERDVVTFNIFVGEIKPEVTEAHLLNAFQPCGPIHSVNIVRDKTTQAPMGYGFVHFMTKEAQQKALIPPYSNQLIAGQACRVNCSDGKNTLFVGNLPPDLKEDEIRIEIEKLVGRATHVELKTGPPPEYASRGFAFATFSDKNNAEIAKRMLIGKFIHGFQVNVKWAEIRRVTAESMAQITTLYIGNLHKCITQEQLSAYFSQWGNIVRCNVVKDSQGVPKGFAFVTYDDRGDCIQALNQSNNQTLCGQCLTVTLATPTNDTPKKNDRNRGGAIRDQRRDYLPPGPPRGPTRGYWDQRPPQQLPKTRYDDPRSPYSHPLSYETAPPGYPSLDPYAAYPGYQPGAASYYPHYPGVTPGYPAATAYPSYPATTAYPQPSAQPLHHATPPISAAPATATSYPATAAYPSAAPSSYPSAVPTSYPTYPTWNAATGTWS